MSENFKFLRTVDKHGNELLICIDHVSHIEEVMNDSSVFHMKNHAEIDVKISIKDVAKIFETIGINDVDA